MVFEICFLEFEIWNLAFEICFLNFKTSSFILHSYHLKPNHPMPPHTLNTLQHLQSKVRLIRAIYLYKLKFEELGAKEERSTRIELSHYDQLQDELNQHIFALSTILKILKQSKSKAEAQKAINSILQQLPLITKQMHLFVKRIDVHSQNIQQWLQKITPRNPSRKSPSV
nr:hypothetical protein [uncultured Marinifilum sp.]